MKQLREIDTKDFNQIVIDELEESYLVKFLDDDGSELSIQYHKNEEDNKLIALVQVYLDIGKVNGLSKMVPVIRSVNKYKSNYAEVFSQNSAKKLKMNIYNPKLRIISKMSYERYLNDRDEYFKNGDIDTIRLNALPGVSKFEVVNRVVNLTLNTDQNVNILDSEKEFMREFLEYKCGRRKIEVVFVEDKSFHDRECIVNCGELKIYFPQNYTFSMILGIIREHNLNVDDKIRKKK